MSRHRVQSLCPGGGIVRGAGARAHDLQGWTRTARRGIYARSFQAAFSSVAIDPAPPTYLSLRLLGTRTCLGSLCTGRSLCSRPTDRPYIHVRWLSASVVRPSWSTSSPWHVYKFSSAQPIPAAGEKRRGTVTARPPSSTSAAFVVLSPSISTCARPWPGRGWLVGCSFWSYRVRSKPPLV